MSTHQLHLSVFRLQVTTEIQIFSLSAYNKFLFHSRYVMDSASCYSPWSTNADERKYVYACYYDKSSGISVAFCLMLLSLLNY